MAPSHDHRSLPARALDVARVWLPQGQLLPDHIWARRHKTIVLLLWAHVVALFAFGLARGNSLTHMVFEASLVAAPALLASIERAGMKLRVAAASFGLITASAMLVHLWDGRIEAHFHFFVMIGVLTLYQDWLPFLLAIGYVAVHHGVIGVWKPENVYSNPDAIAHPVSWAFIHAAFVLAASLAHIIAWRTNETQLLRDPLTGLPSRILFNNRLAQALERLGRRPGQHVAVLFLDLDRFKVINDSLGHSAGDKLIVSVAERLRASVRRHETVARFGGDEFVILVEDIRDGNDAIAVGERILRALSAPFQLVDGDVTTSPGSLGIAFSGDPDQDVEELIRDADAAMYRAKEQGGGRLMLFDEVTRERALSRLHNERALRRAIEREELRVYFQPEVNVGDGAIMGLEALVRWQHPERGLVGPDQFIALAEETGLIVPLGEYVLREACRRTQAWQAERVSDTPLIIRVNVSARQLALGDELVTMVRAVLEETRLDAELLCLEVTESLLVDDPDSSLRTLQALKALGVKIAVDDFGTGYSSLDYLRRFPVDCVKIDRSFVRGIPHSTEDLAIVNAVVELGHALGLSVTAEGVESTDQLDELLTTGCDTAQGFLFSRPEHPDVVERLLLGTPDYIRNTP